jgi:transposase
MASQWPERPTQPPYFAARTVNLTMPAGITVERLGQRRRAGIIGDHSPVDIDLIPIHFGHVSMLECGGTNQPVLLVRTVAEGLMWIAYEAQIPQSSTALLSMERRLRGRPTADRVKLLHLLKTRTCRSWRGAAPLLGYSERQLRRWWATYTAGGLDALVQRPARRGRQAQVSEDAWTALAGEMHAGRVARLKEAQRYLRERWGIAYRSLKGVSRLFIRHKTKLKTGRRRHRRANLAAPAAFKKSLRPAARPAPRAARVGAG